MATPAPEPQPLILTDASLKISRDGTEAGLTELACLTNHIELSPDVSETTLDTMCGSRTYPGTVSWSLIATIYQSFDPDATEEVLSEAVALGDPTPFEVLGYKSKPVSDTNPSWTGMLIPQPYSPINGDAGDASTVELEWSLSGAPVKSVTPPALTAAGTTNYDSMTRSELDQLATDRGLNPADYATKADIVAALQA